MKHFKISTLVSIFTAICLFSAIVSAQPSSEDAAATISLPDYDREEWAHWEDYDKDCINTRHEILIHTSLVEVTMRASNCTVATGEWYDPFTDKTWTESGDVDIDHIVPLNAAHESGGYAWGEDLKELFANDWENLIAVEDNTNSAKSDQRPDEWMPPNEDYWCEYIDRWVAVKNKYGLAYFDTELEKIDEVKSSCD